MMPSPINTYMGAAPHMAHHPSWTTDAILGELSHQLSFANTRRHSKASSGNRAGGAMRVTKPGSASSSPRTSAAQSKRRTLVGDSLQGRFRTQQVDSACHPTPASEYPSEFYHEPAVRPARPMSWHPVPDQYPSPVYHTQPANPYWTSCAETDLYANYQQYPPTPAAYSGYSTPSSGFSPLVLPYSALDSEPCVSAPQILAPLQAPEFQPRNGCPTPVSTSTTSNASYYQGSSVMGNEDEWNPLAAVQRSLAQCTAPPTPELIHPAQRVETKVVTDEPMKTYECLEEDESEGEILYGMGLYDPPEKFAEDAALDLHRSTIFSLLGSSDDYPSGKGLKLEEAWEPPASEDEEDEQDGESDADGEDS